MPVQGSALPMLEQKHSALSARVVKSTFDALEEMF